MSKNNIPSKSMDGLYQTIHKILEDARNSVYRTANFTMVKAYWGIGKTIVEEEQNGEDRAEYGKELIKHLAKKLSNEHGKSFNERNLWYMKQFYQQWINLNALRSELSWTHYRLLLKVESEQARAFYMQEAVECNVSTRTLERQINNLYYQRIIISENKQLVKK